MGRSTLHVIGEIEVTDLRILFESRGLESMPYPIAQYGPRSMGTADTYRRHVAAVTDSFTHGELAKFAAALDISWARPDLRVEYYGHDVQSDEPSHRVAAFRRGDHACLLRQIGSDDRVEIATLSPFDIGPAIAAMAPTLAPGPHPAVTVEGYTRTDEPTEIGLSSEVTRQVVSGADIPHIDAEDVRGFGSVQSNWRPARDWGRDPRAELIRWVYTDGGAYLVQRDGMTAKPLTCPALQVRIDEGIAADVASIRAHRSA